MITETRAKDNSCTG